MSLQITILIKCLATFGAGKWLLSRVGSFVTLQITLLHECLVTTGADKWLLSRVSPFMCVQMVHMFKCLVVATPLQLGQRLLCHG